MRSNSISHHQCCKGHPSGQMPLLQLTGEAFGNTRWTDYIIAILFLRTLPSKGTLIKGYKQQDSNADKCASSGKLPAMLLLPS